MDFNGFFFLSVVAVLLLECIRGSRGTLRCYKCMVAAPVINFENATIRLCKDFDYSDEFIVDCPYSTFCMKKSVSARIPYLINGEERDCASQKRKNHNYVNKQWQIDYVVEDFYEEGCKHQDDKGARTTNIGICYCRGDLCNSTDGLGSRPLAYLLPAVIVLFYTMITHRGAL